MSVPSSELGPHPSHASDCAPEPKGGLACGRGGGRSQFGRLEKKPSTLFALWETPKLKCRRLTFERDPSAPRSKECLEEFGRYCLLKYFFAINVKREFYIKCYNEESLYCVKRALNLVWNSQTNASVNRVRRGSMASLPVCCTVRILADPPPGENDFQ